MEVSFAALGWLCRAADAVGAVRFNECVTRARFNIEQAARHAATPAELAVITGLTSSLEGLIRADAEARGLLDVWQSTFDAAFEAGCLPSATESSTELTE